MRVLDTFTTILVLGILSSTIAQEQSPSGHETTAGVTLYLNIDNVLMECEKNGGSAAHSALEAASRNFSNCVSGLLNLTELEVDRTAAIFHGKWDTVFAKYCRRLPAFLQCTNLVDGLVPSCLTSVDRENYRINVELMTSFMKFICENDGNRTASFFTNRGIECIASKRDTIQRNCPLETFGSNTQPADIAVWIQLGLKNCSVIESFGTCAVQVMRTCENPTPANVVESFFDFLKRRKSCPSIPAAQAT